MADNPAASTRIEHKSRSKAKGQRRHDMREGPQPKYVDPDQTTENSVLMEPMKESALTKLCEKRASHLGRQRARKSNAAIATTGILTFSKTAQPIVNGLPKDEQDRLMLESARNLADTMGTTLHGAVVHRDETALHMHYQLAAVRIDGRPVSKVVDTRHLQDAAAAAWSHLGIGRGTPKRVRQDLGEPASSWAHRTVKQLHEDLPAEVEAAEQNAGERIKAIKADADEQIEAARARAAEAEGERDRLQKQIEEAQEQAKTEWGKFETAEQRRITAERKASEAEGKRKDLERRIATYERRAGDAEQRAKDAEGEVARLQDELKALANSDEDQPKQRQVTVPQTEERGWGPWSRRAVVGERRLTYIKPSDTQKWRGAVLKRAKEAHEEANRRGKEAAAAERQRKQEAEQRQRLQNALIQTMTAPAPCGDADAALWAAEAVLVERYGVQMQVAENIARVPLQEGLSDRQIAAALYREGREQGWERQWFSVSTGIAREIIALARQDLRLDEISFRDDSSGEATSLLQEAIAARDADPMGDPPPRPSPRPRPRDEFGL